MELIPEFGSGMVLGGDLHRRWTEALQQPLGPTLEERLERIGRGQERTITVASEPRTYRSPYQDVVEEILGADWRTQDPHDMHYRLTVGSLGEMLRDPLNRPSVMRDRLIPQFSYSVPCEEALQAIAERGLVVEIGAGGGYWAKLLTELGCDVVAYDLRPRECWASQGHRAIAHRWFDVHYGGTPQAGRHPDRTLMLAWPPHGTPMAHRALQAHYRAGGQTVVYLGEWGGCTADKHFHRMLRLRYREVAAIKLPGLMWLHEACHVLVRRQQPLVEEPDYTAEILAIAISDAPDEEKEAQLLALVQKAQEHTE